jgi:hypothetical protein
MQSLNVIQLRRLLREKFPGLRTHADELPIKTRDGWASGIAKLDERLGGGFPKNAVSEIIAPRRGCGSALLIAQLLRRAAEMNQFVALVDGRNSFDAVALEQSTLSHLLWISCHNADDAVKATDLVLRDGNLPVVLLDLALNPAAELRKIPAPTWYRFQRIVEQSTTTFIAFTPVAMISPAEVRVTLRSRFGLQHIEADQVKLTQMLDFDVRQAGPSEELLRRSA